MNAKKLVERLDRHRVNRLVEDDPTEPARRAMIAAQGHGERAELEKEYGQVWDTSELTRDFEVKGFMKPFVVVRRKSDGKVGSLMFQSNPRLYYNFQEDSR